MKLKKDTSIDYKDKDSVSYSYHIGWQKALENFDKYVNDFKAKRHYRLHSN